MTVSRLATAVGLSFTYLSTVVFDSSNNTRDCVLHSDPHGISSAVAQESRHSAAPPSLFSRRLNSDDGGVPAEEFQQR